MNVVITLLVWGASLARAAINIDGSQAVWMPLDGSSPIDAPETYIPDQHDCPVPCVDYSNPHSWISYQSIIRFSRCQEPMLLQLSVTQAIDDSASKILVRSCKLTAGSVAISNATDIENPKKANNLYPQPLNYAPACKATGTRSQDELALAVSSGVKGNGDEVANLLESMQPFFDARDNCNEKFLFASHKQTVVSIYIGDQLGKATATSALRALAGRLRTDGAVANRTIAQICSSGRHAETVFGIFIENNGDFAAAQKTTLGWSEGKCAAEGQGEGNDEVKFRDELDIEVFEIRGGEPGADNRNSNSTVLNNNHTTISNRAVWSRLLRSSGRRKLETRATHQTCRSIKVVSGDGCDALVQRCGISSADFYQFNPKTGLCANLMPGDDICCSAGDPPAPPTVNKPGPNADGTCATHLIANGDTCDALARQYGVSVADLERWNKGKTWAWTECKSMLGGYNMCLSDGTAPLPPPQQGTECGPLVPGTVASSLGPGMSLADLNPCPLKACCSNWGYCGPFPSHCDIHAPSGGGPGTTAPGFQNTCISNCGMGIRNNSGPPAAFQRVGYYESWNLQRDCLWLKAQNANTDGSYTHIHWGFAEIDPATWKPVIKDDQNQWADFKALPDVKRIVSFGGWAYSTEAATYNIIRQAIISNRDAFASNLAQFIKDEGIDGVDIDWEYPGAPDITVGGQVIGQKGDGVSFLKFLTVLKQKVGANQTVSIAAPASYWYLKAYPIDRIAAVIDYIVYMTYDLHGQWDYGNPNSFDECPSGKCIRSHINLTETINTLGIITKAGVPNNKIFVGEASYGRSFHMAQDSCWGPMCEFTGTRNQSDATPGRCTKTAGYIAAAEINEIIKNGNDAQTLSDDASNTDILLYNGDCVTYMTPTTKDTRRANWKNWNFAGTIDWALDLQSFTADDMNAVPDRPQSGEGCVDGNDDTVNTGDLCEFACNFGFCPESLCSCRETGPLEPLPPEQPVTDVIAWDPLDVDLNRLCKFACKYNYCPDAICTTVSIASDSADDDQTGTIDDPNNPNYFNYSAVNLDNYSKCPVYKDPKCHAESVAPCKIVCQSQLDEAKTENRTSNYGCVGSYPLDQPIPWTDIPGTCSSLAGGVCMCDNWVMNEIADDVINALPIIAEIGCYIIMSALKTVLDVGAQFIPGVGEAIDAGLDMATTAAQLCSYIYPNQEDPEGAFEWWLKPCGGTLLVPDEIKKVFGILNAVAGGVSSFKPPKNIPKGSGRKGDDGNPTDRSGMPKSGSGGSCPPSKVKAREEAGEDIGNKPPCNNPKPKTSKKCNVPDSQSTKRMGIAGNTLRMQSCVRDTKKTDDLIITSLTYAANAVPTRIAKDCKKAWSQACFHYSSAIRVNPHWETLTCPPEAAATAHREKGKATSTWESQHRGDGWRDPNNRVAKDCDRDEYPPAYLLGPADPALLNGGINARGQLIRYIPKLENSGAGQMFKGACFVPPVKALSDREFRDRAALAPAHDKKVVDTGNKRETFVGITVDQRPEFSWGSWFQAGNPPVDDGMRDNTCWPSVIAAKDPGFPLLTYDPWYNGKPMPYDYQKPYVKGKNGE